MSCCWDLLGLLFSSIVVKWSQDFDFNEVCHIYVSRQISLPFPGSTAANSRAKSASKAASPSPEKKSAAPKSRGKAKVEIVCTPVDEEEEEEEEEESEESDVEIDWSDSPIFSTVFARVILDEAHRIKSRLTSTCQAATTLDFPS